MLALLCGAIILAWLIAPQRAGAATSTGSIAGTVTSAATSAPIAGIEVCALDEGEGSDPCSRTDASGGYTIPGLPPGTYFVTFTGPREGGLDFVGQYYDEGAVLTVSAGMTTSNIDAALRTGGEITGTVVNAATRTPIPHLLVCGYASVEFGEACARTDEAGRYTLPGLPAGEYRVEFSPEEGAANYLTQYFDDQTVSSGATLVVVHEGVATPHIDAALREGAQIAGQVVAATTKVGIGGIEVCAAKRAFRRCSKTDATGQYTLPGLQTGSYTVEFSSPSSSGPNYITQYYNAQPAQYAATPVHATAGQSAGNVDAAMQPGGAIEGTVESASTHEALAGVEICVESVTNGARGGCAATDASGKYAIRTLTGGEYYVSFFPDSEQSTGYVWQYYDGKTSRSEAKPVQVTAGVPTEGIDASLGALGKVAGLVTSAATHAPIEGITVCAGGLDVYGFYPIACSKTAADGTYTIAALSAGSYDIEFLGGEAGGVQYVTQYYDNEPSTVRMEQVSVSNGATASGVDAAMQVGGTITGTVTNAATAKPVEAVTVCARETRQSGVEGCTMTDGNGHYTISGLPSGAYEVEFSPDFTTTDYLPELYDGKPSSANANYVYVNAERSTEHVDAALQPGGVLTGTVTSAETHQPLENVSACAIRANQTICAATKADGTYTIAGLAPGAYSVAFYPSSPYVRQYYSDASNLSLATPVDVTSGGIQPGVDAALQVGGTIGGTVVSSATHEPLEGIRVCAEGVLAYQCEATGPKGSYTLRGLPTGSYRVTFDGGRLDGVAYLTQYYSGKTSINTAQTVSVVAGAPTEAIDAAMHTGGEITGRVTSAGANAPLQGVFVCAERVGGAFGGCTGTNSQGEYALASLGAGEYEVTFYGETAEAQYLTQYYNGKTSSGEATRVSVGEESAATGIDAVMHTAGVLSGTVTSAATGLPLAGVEVCAYPVAAGGSYGCEYTDLAGEYSLDGLPSGPYRMGFSTGFGTPYLTQFYQGQAALSEADTVEVHAEATTSHVDAAMRTGGHITGTVTSAATSTAIQGINVCAGRIGGGSYGCAATNSSGEYEISELESGSYTVAFTQGSAPARYVSQYFSDKTLASEADPVPVTVEAVTPHVDAAMQLQEVGEIAGTVTSQASKEAIAGIGVCATRVGGDGSECMSTGANGTYSLSGLTPGEYDVSFAQGTAAAEYLTQYYDDRASSGEATPVSVIAGHATAEIDASMRAPGRITGSVTSFATGAKLEGIQVCAFGASDVCATTNANGEYELRGLAVGLYSVSFSTTSGHAYLLQYYEGKASSEEAQQILIAAESTVTGVDAGMRSGGTISGTVTDAATSRPAAGVKVCAGGSAVLECGFTGLDGKYTISELPPGNYVVAFATGTSGGAYKTQFYPDKLSAAEATTIALAAEAAAPGIDAAMAPGLPIDRAAPTISGRAVEGSTLSEEHGTWANAPSGFSYQWLRCDAFGEGCFAIYGATGQSYQPTTEDVGSVLRVEETAVNEFGAGEAATSTATAVVAASAPVDVTPPQIQGRPEQGQQLVAVRGVWTSTPTEFAYQWLRCDPATAQCKPIGATHATYTPVAEDVGSTLEVQETASNAGGTGAPATSAPTPAISGPVPLDAEPPTIAGVARQGQTLSAQPGSWTNSPSGFAYQWRRCLGGGAGCVEIPGATGQAYHVVDADVHHTLKVQVIASNGAGSSEPALSHATAEAVGEIPQNVTSPTASGLAEEGETLVDAPGTWTNEPSHFTYQWLRCDASGASCKAIVGAVDQTYRAVEADRGSTLVVEESAIDSTGRSALVRSEPSATISPGKLRAVAGEDVTTTVEEAVTFDGSGSTPTREITGYKWNFGDGASSSASAVQHSYSHAGTYTATLTIESKSETAEKSVTVTVNPTPAQQVEVTVQSPDHAAIAAADVVYIGADGSRIQGVTDGEGVATLAGLPDGSDTIYVYREGYKPLTAQVTVAGGAGHATVTLVPGAVATAKLTSRPMTLKEIEEAGIDPSDPANRQVYAFSSQIAFGGSEQELRCNVNAAAQFVGTCGFSGGSSACSPNACQGSGVVAVPASVDNQPVIEWLILPGSVTVLKQFFTVSMIVQNLSGEEFSLTGGHATLNLAPGVSLAPTAAVQTASRALPDIPGGGSATATWVVRGDEPGKYYLSADYAGTLSKVQVPVTLHAALAEPLRVWGAEALSLTVKADAGAPQAGVPYHVTVGLANRAPVPLYNVSLQVEPTPPEHFIFQPEQRFGDTFSEVPAGGTVYSHTYVYVPDSYLPAFTPALSSVGFAGQALSPGEGLEAIPPPPLYALTAPTDTPNEVHLHWQPVPGATGYEIFTIPNLDTPFGTTPTEAIPAGSGEAVSRLPASSTDAFVPQSATSPPQYFALSAIVGGHLTLESPVISAVAGPEPSSPNGGAGGGGGGSGPACAPGEEEEVQGHLLEAKGCFVRSKSGTYTAVGKVLVNGIGFVPKTGSLTIDPGAPAVRASGSGAIELAGRQVWAWAGSLNLVVPPNGQFTLIPANTSGSVFGFPISGSLVAEFTDGGAASLKGTVGLHVLGEDVEASLELSTDNRTNGGLASAEVEVKAAEADPKYHAFQYCQLGAPTPTGWHCEKVTAPNGSDIPRLLANNPGVVRIGGILPVEDVALSYEAAHHVWGAKAALAIGDLLPGPEIVKKALPTLELGGKIGTEPAPQLYGLSAGVKNLDLPLGPALLKELGFELELHPDFGLSGDLGLETLGHTMSIEAGFEYKRPSQHPGFSLVVHGSFTLESQLSVEGRVEYDQEQDGSRLLASGTFTKSWGPVSASIGIGGGFEPGHFELTGSGSIGAFGANVQGRGIVSDAGVGACGEVHVFIFNGQVGFRHFWSGKTDFEGCDFSGLYTVGGSASAAAAAGHAFRLPAHRSKQEFAAVGANAPPSVTLVGPHGEELQTPAQPDKLTFSRQGAALAVSSSRTTYFIVSQPSRGVWRILPTPGAAAPIRYEQADPLLPLGLSGHVSARGRVRTFAWRLTPQHGESVRFIQVGGAEQPIVATRAGRGIVRFRVAAGPTGRRTIVALVSFDGIPRRQVTVASFRARAAAAPKVFHAVYRVAHGKISMSWRRAAGASYYELLLRTSLGLREYRLPASVTRLTLPMPAGGRVKLVTITTSVSGVAGPPVPLRRRLR